MRSVCSLQGVADKTHQEISTILEKFRDSKVKANSTSSDLTEIAFVAINCKHVKTKIVDAATSHVNIILNALNVALRKKKNASIIADYEEILRKVSVRPTDEEELIELKAFVNSLGTVVRQTKKRVQSIHELLSLAGQHGFRVPFDDFALAYGTMEWPQRVNWAFSRSQDALEKREEENAKATRQRQNRVRKAY